MRRKILTLLYVILCMTPCAYAQTQTQPLDMVTIEGVVTDAAD
jgi:hypothetical protein